MKLDAIIAGAYNISRNISQELIKNGCVKVNQTEILNTSHELKIDNLISVRGKGRFKLLNILGTSKSSRIVLEIGKYVWWKHFQRNKICFFVKNTCIKI